MTTESTYSRKELIEQAREDGVCPTCFIYNNRQIKHKTADYHSRHFLRRLTIWRRAIFLNGSAREWKRDYYGHRSREHISDWIYRGRISPALSVFLMSLGVLGLARHYSVDLLARPLESAS